MTASTRLACVTALVAACGGSNDTSPLWDLPLCEPVVDQRDLIHVNANMDGPPTGHELRVVMSWRDYLRLEAVPGTDTPAESFVELDFLDELSDDLVLPQVDDLVTAFGGICYSGGYVRLVGAGGELLFEGGNPWCTGQGGAFGWEGDALMSARPAVDPETCRNESGPDTDECCCVTERQWEVLLTADGDAEVLPFAAPRELVLEGRRYRAEARFAREQFDSPCTRDLRRVLGSAFVAPLL